MERTVWAWMPVAASVLLWIGAVACAAQSAVLPQTVSPVVNRAQFALFHSLGYPAQELAQLRPPGEVVPVDTSRPKFLPSVGHGPPPTTR
jgi:hypothetical protein